MNLEPIENFRVKSPTSSIPTANASMGKVEVIKRLWEGGDTIDDIVKKTFRGRYEEKGDRPLLTPENDPTPHAKNLEAILRYRQNVCSILGVEDE